MRIFLARSASCSTFLVTAFILIAAGSACSVRNSGGSEPSVQVRSALPHAANDSVSRTIRALWHAVIAPDDSVLEALTIHSGERDYLRLTRNDSMAMRLRPEDFILEEVRWIGPEEGLYIATFLVPGKGCRSRLGVYQEPRFGFMLRRDLGWRVEGLYNPNRECARD